MRKNYFAKIVNYTKKVFNIEKSINKLSDRRKNPRFKTNQVVLPVLLGFLLRVRSFNELNNIIKDNEFSKVFQKGTELPKIDAIRDTFKVIDIEGLRGLLTQGIRRAKENKIFDCGTIDGLVVAAIDGTQVYNSDKKHCEQCLKA